MKVEVIVQKTVCDLCESKDCFSVCQGCGIDICYGCEESVCTVVHNDVYTSNTFLYCPTCCQDHDIVTSDLFRAFQTVERLRDERVGYLKKFEERAEAARINLEKILEEKEKV